MVHRFVPRCQIGPGSNPASVVCGWWFCVWVCRAVGPGPLLLAVPGPAVWCVLGGVLLSRTLAGAVPSALSGLASGFGMGAGRFPVAVTTETTVRAVRGPLSAAVVRVIRLSGLPADHTLRVWLVVGLGVDRIVDALRSCWSAPLLDSLTSCVVVGVLLFVLAY